MRDYTIEPSRDLALRSSHDNGSRDGSGQGGEIASNSAADVDSLAAVKATETRNTAIVVVPALLVLVTFLFWYQTWFGRRLGHDDLAKYLSDTSAPHKTQHALA